MIRQSILLAIIIITISSCNTSTDNKKTNPNLSNKKVIETYIDGFNKSDHAQILSCLTDHVIWDMPGVFHKVGKAEFDKEIENDAFVGSPSIIIIRLIEEGDIVVAEGSVTGKMKGGGLLDAVFCDVFHFENGKIKQLTSYLMQNKHP
jgi:ketosteroid isomerase-like protein